MPARCAEMLNRKEVEGALIPVIEYQRIPGIRLVPDVCVGSRKSVRSVVLVSKKDTLGNIRSVALDASSRTSVVLLKIIFREFLHREPQWKACKPDIDQMLNENDAALLIGDPAMTLNRAELHVFDMATLWQQYTGKGFIFAMWALREDSLKHCGHIDFTAARDEGLKQIDKIVSHYERHIPLPRKELTTYLTENINYQIDKRMEEGLRLYFNLAFKHGLIEERKITPIRKYSVLID